MADADVATSATHTEEVAAPFDVVWKLLEEKVYLPTKHVPGVTAVTIVHDGGPVEGVERRMTHAVKGEIHERITWAVEGSAPSRKGVVTFTMLSDPTLEGDVRNEAQEIDAGKTRVTYTMLWKFQAGVPQEKRVAPFPDRGAGAVVGAVRHLKAGAEREVQA